MSVDVKAFLGGAYNTTTDTMNDSLRSLGYLPTIEPYSYLGYDFLYGGHMSVST